MKKQTHKWKAHGRTIYAGKQIVSLAVSDYDAERAPEYNAADNLPTDDEGLDNADLICRAVNCHEQLLQSLAVIAAISESGTIARHETNKPTWYATEEISSLARAAIAAAYQSAQAGGMNATDSEEFAKDQATR